MNAKRTSLSLAALALGACSSDQLPNGTVLTIAPTEQSILITEYRNADGRCTIDPSSHVDLPIVLSLHDGQGSPIGQRELAVYVDFAANTFSGYPVLALYRDLNGNGVVDADTELVSGREDDIARVETGRYDGASALMVRANLSCGYRGRVFAYVGDAFASAAIEIEAEEVIEPDPPETDASGVSASGAERRRPVAGSTAFAPERS